MKKLFAIFIVTAMLFSLSACANASTQITGAAKATEEPIEAEELVEEEPIVSGTFTGTISSVDGDKITIQTEDEEEISFTVAETTEYSLEMNEKEAMESQPDGEAPSEMPTEGGQQGGETPPEMPTEGGQQGGETPPEMPTEGGQQGGGQPGMAGGDSPMSENQMNGDNSPEKPDGESQMNDNPMGGENPPEKPDGENQMNSEAPMDMPSGEASQEGMQPEAQQSAEPEEPDVNMLTEGTKITVTIGEDGVATEVKIQMGESHGDGMNSQSANIEYTAVNTYAESVSLSNQSVESTGKDENAVLVTGGEVSLDNVTVSRVSSESTGGDDSSFYGIGAAVLTTDGTVSISNSTISTEANGGAGVFAYGDGTAYVSDTTITTTKGTSGGIHVAGGGTLYAWDLNVETSGESSAAIRSDRGSGIMVVDGGSYISNGTGSPAIYSTADITVNDSELTANNSEAICIEGQNSIRLYDCDLTGSMKDDKQNDCTWNVILYQSMSGDSTEGNSLFEMVGGTLTAKNGGLFYTTNTESTFVLSDVDIEASEDCDFFLKCTGNANQRGWGKTGSNGAQCTFTAIDQDMIGDVYWDSISTLDFYMTDGSTLTGAFLQDESNAGNGGSGYAALNIAENCTWVVTADSTLSALTSSGNIIDEEGRTVSIMGTDGTIYVSGNSDLVITVETYSNQVDLTGCSTASTFADYAVEKK